MTDTVLKPCPFCGGTAEIKRRGTARMSMLIGCVDCHAEVESGDVCGVTAVENYKWNMRKPLAKQEPVGYMLVPIEPTEAMMRAAMDCQDADPGDSGETEMYYAYKAMLASLRGKDGK